MARIAIIGSGIGSASVCYYLNDLFKEKVEICVFESENKIGGRNLSMEING